MCGVGNSCFDWLPRLVPLGCAYCGRIHSPACLVANRNCIRNGRLKSANFVRLFVPHFPNQCGPLCYDHLCLRFPKQLSRFDRVMGKRPTTSKPHPSAPNSVQFEMQSVTFHTSSSFSPTPPSDSPASQTFPANSKLIITQIPIPISLIQHTTTTTTAPEKTTTTERFLLPKLPAGVQAPSKIIFIQGESSENPSVHILNTSRARLGHSEQEIRKRILTGESPFPSKILPKPQDYPVHRPVQQVVYNSDTGEWITKKAIPKIHSAVSPKKRRVCSHLDGSKEDALDGFDEDYSALPVVEVPEGTEAYALVQDLHLNGPGRLILPRPPKPTNFIVTSDGTPVQISVQHSPDTFIAPKRKRKLVTTIRNNLVKILPGEELIDLGNPLAANNSSTTTIIPPKKRQGRPSHLKRSTAQLLSELKRDCLTMASDGRNLKCLACNCVLTKHGWGYSRQIIKHLTQVLSHKSRYDLWRRLNEQGVVTNSEDLPETARNRGRYRKTALDYFNEFKSEWLELSADGQILTCAACNTELVVNNQRIVSGDISRHLLRDPKHLGNVVKMRKEQRDFVPELSDITDSVVEEKEYEMMAEYQEEEPQEGEPVEQEQEVEAEESEPGSEEF